MLLKLNPHGLDEYAWINTEVLGLIPYILSEAVGNAEDINDFIPTVEAAYGYGLYQIDEATVTDGVYSYPEDPDLHPLASYKIPKFNITIYQYPYGFVAFVMEDYEVVFRMD